MSFQADISQLESAFIGLKQRTGATTESWNDQVQKRFYEQFIDTLPKEFAAFTDALNRLDKILEVAEQRIRSLK
jgi:hypothetical protein